MEETILSKIRNEHAMLLIHMKEVEESRDVHFKGILYRHLKDELLEYLQAKELSIYRHFREDIPKPIARELSEASHKEHHRIKEYLQKLNLLNISDDEWKRTFSELRHFVEMQADLEELIMFNEAKEDFSREELIEIGTEYESSKHLSFEQVTSYDKPF